MQPSLLIMDDDGAFARAVKAIAEEVGYRVFVAPTMDAARRLLDGGRMDLLLLDLNLPDGCGLDLIDEVDMSQHGQIALVTGNPTIETAARAVAGPVIEYLVKPVDPFQLRKLMERIRAAYRERDESATEELVGRSLAMRRVVETMLRIAPSEASVLLVGESGTGKELVARALHRGSGASGPFVALNCGAVPPELLASQLFGHERGSFTGAHARHIGVFEQASHGTLLLDEITEMPSHLQVYLLRVLEGGTITRVGGNESIATPVRIIAATNRDPLRAIADGSLREDLFYRLADVPISLPPLRERDDDVLLLAHLFIERLNRNYGRRKRLAPECELALLQHSWPGNVRELRSAVQRAYLLETGDAIHVQPYRNPVPATSETATTILFTVGTTLAEIERRVLLKTLAHYGNDKTATAHALGVSVRTVHNQLTRMRESGDEDAAA